MCRGIEEEEVTALKRGLMLEDLFWYLSRAYVPCAFYYGYKVGHFEEKF